MEEKFAKEKKKRDNKMASDMVKTFGMVIGLNEKNAKAVANIQALAAVIPEGKNGAQ